MTHDIAAIRASFPLIEVVRRSLKVEKRGKDNYCLCPFHAEKTPSLIVYHDHFNCFGCGEHGDVIDWVRKTQNCDFLGALKFLGVQGDAPLPPAPAIITAAKPEFVSAYPPDDAPEPDMSGYDHVYAYRAPDGRPVRYIVRIDARGKRAKKTIPITWGTFEGETGWHFKHANAPRILYGVDLLAERPDAPAMICEGEKATDAAGAQFPRHVCVTWSGGTNATHMTDWTPLMGRDVIIWPDNDPPGLKCADTLAAHLRDIAASVSMMRVDDLPVSGDAADVTVGDPALWLRERLPVEAPRIDPPPTTPTQHTSETVIPLGHNRGTYYYYSTETKQISELTPQGHTRAALSGMASVPQYWERMTRFRTDKGDMSWTGICDWMMEQSRIIGIFNPERVRGRGAWVEKDGKIVVHTGETVIVDGENVGLVVPGSKYVYEASHALIDAFPEPLDTKAANWLMKICKMPKWEKPVFGVLLAGWCVIAPICGALRWRSSIWITGPSGCGKSWIYDEIIGGAIGDWQLAAMGSTTESFLRQDLVSDAIPVCFDESERNDDRAISRMGDILELMRSSSKETRAVLGRGSASGKGTRYKIRSAFCFVSVNVSLLQKADETRVTVLGLRATHREGDVLFDDLAACVRERFGPKFAPALIARTIRLAPVIRQNAEIFSSAIAAIFNSRRLGDQYGTLFAGAYSLHSAQVITPAAATEYVKRQDWDEVAPAQAETDESKLVQHLVTIERRVGAMTVPVSRLIEAVITDHPSEAIVPHDVAVRSLADCGMRIGSRDGVGGLYVSTSHPELKRALKSTSYGASWARTLARLPGAQAGRDVPPQRFATGTVTRAVWVPLAALDGG